jgi:hypothetical protein
VFWSSDNPGVIGLDGTVKRPTYGDAIATLTVTYLGPLHNTESEQYKVTVKKASADDNAVASDASTLSVGFNGTDTTDNVTQNITLPTGGSHGTSISWSSDNTSDIFHVLF